MKIMKNEDRINNWDDFSVHEDWNSKIENFMGDWRDATSGCWMIGHGQPYVHVASSKHGWLVESGCLEPARCFSSRSKLDSPWCSHGALLFTLVCTVPTFIDLRITKRRVILHKTSIDMEGHAKQTICRSHFANGKSCLFSTGSIGCRVPVHHQEHVAGYLDQVFWWNTGDLILNVANNMNWVCPEKGYI